MTGGEKNRVPPEMEARETVPIGSEEKCQLPHPEVREEPFLSRARTRTCTHTHTHKGGNEKEKNHLPSQSRGKVPSPQPPGEGERNNPPPVTHTHARTHTPYSEKKKNYPLLNAGRENHPPPHTLR